MWNRFMKREILLLIELQGKGNWLWRKWFLFKRRKFFIFRKRAQIVDIITIVQYVKTNKPTVASTGTTIELTFTYPSIEYIDDPSSESSYISFKVMI